MRAQRSTLIATRRTAALCVAAALLLGASPALAAPEWLKMPSFEMPDLGWEGSKAEDITAKSVDAVIVRPLATIRVMIGGCMFLPAALLSSPMGREGFDGAYDLLIAEPVEYAFKRPLGEL